MSSETIRELQGYGFFVLLVVMVVTLYSYWFHLKRSEKSKKKNYEQYSKLALNDSLDDQILEHVSTNSDNNDNRSVDR